MGFTLGTKTIKKHQRLSTRSKAKSVKKEYATKAQKLDTLYTPEATRPGPFAGALTTFHGGGVTPFCFGAFGEVSEEVDPFVKRCARLAAAKQEGLAISPLEDSNGPLGSYSLTIRRFRTALSCVVSKENAKLKVKRTQFIRSTREAAAYATKDQDRGSTGYFQNMYGSHRSNEDTYATYFAAGSSRRSY